MYKVIINGKTQYAEEGTLLSQLLMKAGESIPHPCGGKGICKKCLVCVNGKNELSCRYAIKSDICVSFTEEGEIVSETGIRQSGELTQRLCYALDIGTTTLALALVSLDEGEIIRVITRTNPQRIYGADVISRIEYCRKNGVGKLNSAVIGEINSMIAEIGLHRSERLFVAGNTTMLHLFFGEDCSSMGEAPYTPVFLDKRTEGGEALGLKGVTTAEALPSIDTFAGADILAGMSLAGLPPAGKHRLLADLGTNAEIVLFSDTSALCTAAAAGPCFEGANISCGMSAVKGAIYSYSPEGIKTVGNIPPVGICGTGLIDVVARLYQDEEIDESGFMDGESLELSEGVYITQADIRQYQLAKSAVCSAILTLMQMKNVSFEDIDCMYISGGFSDKINISSAVITGLLPKELSRKCIALNNSSLAGTVKYILEGNDLSLYAGRTSYIDLSSEPVFSELFMKNMGFGVIF